VDDWYGEFYVAEVSWASDCGVSACFASLSWFECAEASVHEAGGDWCAVFVIGVWCLDFDD
jgi:flavin reductase (DIM6/NTAB) family NADH-FMN oxidoreductase RutF